MGKTPIVLFGIGASWVFGLGCQSEGKLPFGDDELAPGDSAGQAGAAGASGRGGSSAGGSGSALGGSSGTSGGSSGVGGSSAGRGGSSGVSGSSGSSGMGGSSSIGDPESVGQSCDYDSDCKSIPKGYCADAGICTASCVTHVDCGCPVGTVNTDIAAGECAAACITYDDGTSFCQRVCDSSSCSGNSYCEELDFYSVCTPR